MPVLGFISTSSFIWIDLKAVVQYCIENFFIPAKHGSTNTARSLSPIIQGTLDNRITDYFSPKSQEEYIPTTLTAKIVLDPNEIYVPTPIKKNSLSAKSKVSRLKRKRVDSSNGSDSSVQGKVNRVSEVKKKHVKKISFGDSGIAAQEDCYSLKSDGDSVEEQASPYSVDGICSNEKNERVYDGGLYEEISNYLEEVEKSVPDVSGSE